jgi:60 kDa SS-A/Ro ribonucleoprotein
MVNLYTRQDETVRNNAGGEVFQITPMQQFERFLILGTVGGTYYVSEKQLTKENLQNVTKVIRENPSEAIELIRTIGKSNRAHKHDPLLAAYAIALEVTKGTSHRAYALSFFNEIVRTGTHLFHFLAFADNRVGWGRAFKRAIGNWYLEKSDEALAYQLVKYKQRDGWSHRDALRLAHPQATSAVVNELLRFATTGTLNAMDTRSHDIVSAAVEASTTEDVDRAITLITEFSLPREVLNTKIMKNPRVWEALVPSMGMTALMRNLRNMTNDGYLVQGSDAVRTVREKLVDEALVRKSRVHPAQVFLAQKNATNVPTPIATALEDAFFFSFANVEPTNKRINLALDVSGSMDSADYEYRNGKRVQTSVATPREWSALQAMVTARVEPYAEFTAFSHEFVRVDITPRDSLATVINKLRRIPMGGTDCSLPMQHARDYGQKFDAFCVYTDNETWYRGGPQWGWGGSRRASKDQSPAEALRDYRRKSGIHDAKLAVVGITATEFSIADPRDPNMLDFVGFDASAPAIMSEFIRG